MAHIFFMWSCSGNGGAGGTVMKAKKPLISSGAWTMNSRYHFIMSARLVQFPEHRSGADRVHRMGLEEERGDDAEVAAAAANRPEQIAILVGAGDDETSVGEHHIGRQQVVDGQAVLAREVAHAAAERQPADAGAADDAATAPPARTRGWHGPRRPTCSRRRRAPCARTDPRGRSGCPTGR